MNCRVPKRKSFRKGQEPSKEEVCFCDINNGGLPFLWEAKYCSICSGRLHPSFHSMGVLWEAGSPREPYNFKLGSDTMMGNKIIKLTL